ncbi:hypothetical protein [Idiomarina xiamenensis]|uniref:Lipoprotein n=1 Tax=Idiomarina xiamenensis 10-D-4 TaxID=740709 RepID=K2LCG7_9GAMM|nr:hypothetical protein [Idiomarina xiamenensis]EKE87570.1 hypothetical protein A10D4_00710 [Idiomarina xiamenensis 10-D-4]
MMLRTLISVFLIAVLAGCSAFNRYTQQANQSEAEVSSALVETVNFYSPYDIYDNNVEARFLARQSGFSCPVQGQSQQQMAMLDLKAAVQAIGGNGVVLERCHEVQTDQCLAAIQCDGDAYRVQDNRAQIERTASDQKPKRQSGVWF